MKLVELEILKISYLGNFSSCYMFLGVILKNSLNFLSLGGITTVHRRIRAEQCTTWAPARPVGVFPAASRRRRGSQ
jgi:hypothetical protein